MRNIVVILSFFIVACTTTPKIMVVDSAGRLAPEYTNKLRSLTEDLSVIFWYTTYMELEDIDGSIVEIPHYIDMQEPFILDTSIYRGLELHMEVHNPTQITYQLVEYFRYFENGGDRMVMALRPVATSNLVYRTYKFEIPALEGMEASYRIVVSNYKGESLFTIGALKYTVRGGGVKNGRMYRERKNG